MNKNIISNNCIAGFIYKLTDSIYDHPFMWSTIKYDSFVSLVDLYDSIDFSNATVESTILNRNYWGNTFSISIDNKLYASYIHHKQDDNARELEIRKERNGNNLYYYDMKNYVLCQYLERARRMTENGLKHPIFIFEKTGFYSDGQFASILYKATTYKKIVCLSPGISVDYSKVPQNTFIVNIPENKMVENKCAKHLVENYPDLLELR